MSDIPDQLRAIKVNGSKFEKDLALLDAADTIAAQQLRIQELEKQVENALTSLNALDDLYEKSRNREVKEIRLKGPINDEKFAAILIHTHDEIIKTRKSLSNNGGFDNG